MWDSRIKLELRKSNQVWLITVETRLYWFKNIFSWISPNTTWINNDWVTEFKYPLSSSSTMATHLQVLWRLSITVCPPYFKTCATDTEDYIVSLCLTCLVRNESCSVKKTESGEVSWGIKAGRQGLSLLSPQAVADGWRPIKVLWGQCQRAL